MSIGDAEGRHEENTMDRRQLMEGLLGTALGAGVVSEAQAQEKGAGGPPTVKERMQKALAGVPGKQVTVVTVEYAPGGRSAPHTHSGPVFGYVLEGAVVFGLDDGPETVLRAGDVFYEAPRQVHRTSRNASGTQPARLLAIIVGEEGQPITTPLK
jgi:quercetin dioxygenase-like cupin family protein